MFVYDPPQTDEYSEFFWRENFLSDDEVNRVLALGEKHPWQDAGVYVQGSTEPDRQYRHASLCSLPLGEETQWLYEKLAGVAYRCNRARYHFDLTGIFEPIALNHYAAGGHFEWHKDHGNGPISVRKLSLIVQLSHPDDYEGGDLEFLGDEDPEPALRQRGTVIIFPAFVAHHVTPVTSGARTSLVAWIAGPPFR